MGAVFSVAAAGLAVAIRAAFRIEGAVEEAAENMQVRAKAEQIG